MYPSLIEIGSKTAEKNCTNKQTNRHYENNGHLAVNRYPCSGQAQSQCNIHMHNSLFLHVSQRMTLIFLNFR